MERDGVEKYFNSTDCWIVLLYEEVIITKNII